MLIMSGLSTKEWERVLLAGSRGWSILKAPPPLLSVPVTARLPARNALPLASTVKTTVLLGPETPCRMSPDPKWATNEPATPLGLSRKPTTAAGAPEVAFACPKMAVPLGPAVWPNTPNPPPLVAWASPSTPAPPELAVSPNTPYALPVAAALAPYTPMPSVLAVQPEIPLPPPLVAVD